MEILEREKDFIKIKVEDIDVLPALVKELNEDENVSFASFAIEHPLEDNKILVVRTKKGKPETAIKKAIKSLEKKLKDLESSL